MLNKSSTSKKARKVAKGTSTTTNSKLSENSKKKAVISEDSSSWDSQSEGENDGVNEAGLERLMKALGEDGLDKFAHSFLQALDNGEFGGKESSDDQSEDEEKEDKSQPKDQARAKADMNDDESDLSQSEEEEDNNETILKAREEEDEVDLDEVSSVDEDAVPRQKLVIDNKEAMERIRTSIGLDPSLPWTETLATTYPAIHDVDVSDDLNRELSFYKQALYSAEKAKELAAKHSLQFTRPSDYFAEMVKSDSHMERIRQRLLDEGAAIKKSEQKKREREGKKFGKQVQIEKLREREKGKKDLDEKLKSLKRKRKGGGLEDEDGEDFDVALEDAISDHPKKKARMPRSKREAKYGFGGRGSVGWRAKQNTRDSTDVPFSGKGKGKGARGGKMGGAGPKRLGKSRRMAKRSKR